MPDKRWEFFDAHCDNCGNCEVEVLTETREYNLAYDGDEARCPGCDVKGTVVTREDENAYISWEE